MPRADVLHRDSSDGEIGSVVLPSAVVLVLVAIVSIPGWDWLDVAIPLLFAS
jgi:hypothetical protein